LIQTTRDTSGTEWISRLSSTRTLSSAQPGRVVFLLWGAFARRKAPLVTGRQHVVLEAGHPSPANVRGFWGSRPFRAVNAALIEAGREPIRWAGTPVVAG
jgi:uracil DNA glycosylase